jgi:hypothetical protein
MRDRGIDHERQPGTGLIGGCPLAASSKRSFPEHRWQAVFSPARLCAARRQGVRIPTALGCRVPPPVCVQRDPGSDYRAGVAS